MGQSAGKELEKGEDLLPSKPKQCKSGQFIGVYQNRWNPSELGVLYTVFRDLVARSPSTSDNTIDKATFLKYFDLPGVLGEQLFLFFDKHRDNEISYDEFVDGLAQYSRGNFEDKVKMLYSMYNMSAGSGVTREELATMLHSLVTPLTSFLPRSDLPPTGPQFKPLSEARRQQQQQLMERALSDHERQNSGNEENGKSSRSPSSACPESRPREVPTPPPPIHLPRQQTLSGRSSRLSHNSSTSIGRMTVNQIVEDAFNKCDLNADQRLDYGEFKKFITRYPEVLESLERVFIMKTWADPPRIRKQIQQMEREAEEQQREKGDCGWGCELSAQLQLEQCQFCGAKVDPAASPHFTQENQSDPVFLRGTLYTKPKKKRSNSVYCIIYGTFLYIYEDQVDYQAKDIIYLDGCTIDVEEEEDDDYIEGAGFDGSSFSPMSSPRLLGKSPHRNRKPRTRNSSYHSGSESSAGSRNRRRSGQKSKSRRRHPMYEITITAPSNIRKPIRLYASSSHEHMRWTAALRKSSKNFPISMYYKIDRQLGKGKFASVYSATQLQTGKKFAVKVLQKADQESMNDLRVEIAILKLVDHPHLCKLVDVFETDSTVYIVMPLVTGGELFHRVVARKHFPEPDAKLIAYRLLDAIEYLHERGIVHRDLKPENVLCKAGDDTDVMITDFGLSSFMRPAILMDKTCGTLNYVAPEVLLTRGYTKAIDVWALGVIIYIVLRGGFPFPGKTNEETMDNILSAEPSFRSKIFENVSEEAKDLIRMMLKKDPKDRVTVKGAKAHPWFDDIRDTAVAPYESDALLAESIAREDTTSSSTSSDSDTSEDEAGQRAEAPVTAALAATRSAAPKAEIADLPENPPPASPAPLRSAPIPMPSPVPIATPVD